MSLHKPNVVLPLALSYNPRGIDSYANTITNSRDQRKINVQYEPVPNAPAGKSTMYVTPRPGVSRESPTFGSADQTAYLISLIPGQFALTPSTHWVFSTKGNDVRASESNLVGGDTTTISSDGLMPKYVDRTNIGGTETLVLQIGSDDPTKAYFSTDISTWTEISDSDFPAAIQRGKMEHLDGYASVLTSGNKIVTSDLNSLVNWTATSFITKQVQQDVAVGMARLGNQLLAFAANTVEVARNAGNKNGSPLEFVPQLAAGVGLAEPVPHGTHYYAELGQRIYFLGRQAGNRTEGLWTYNGATFEKVSPPSIDRILASTTSYSVNRIVYAGQEAIAISLSLPSDAAPRWLMFFPRWNDWFEWTSDVFQPVNSGTYFVASGTAAANRIYSIATTDKWIDHSTDYTREIVFKVPTQDNSLKRMPWCGIQADTMSAGASTSAASYIQVAFAGDDYSFGADRQIDLRHEKKQIHRCGAFRDRAVRLRHSGNAQFRIQNFIAKTL